MNSRSQNRHGFTLVETMITITLLSAMFAITGTVMVRMAGSWRAQQAYTQVTGALRDATLALSSEIEAAAFEDNSTIAPPIKGLSLDKSGTSVSYQVPLSLDGKTWSNVIVIRLRSEDRNMNLQLDKGEDEDGNGFLDRVIERLEDLDGDGAYKSPGETRILAKGIDKLTFKREENSRKISVIVTSRYPDLGKAKHVLAEEQTFSVVVRN